MTVRSWPEPTFKPLKPLSHPGVLKYFYICNHPYLYLAKHEFMLRSLTLFFNHMNHSRCFPFLTFNLHSQQWETWLSPLALHSLIAHFCYTVVISKLLTATAIGNSPLESSAQVLSLLPLGCRLHSLPKILRGNTFFLTPFGEITSDICNMIRLFGPILHSFLGFYAI